MKFVLILTAILIFSACSMQIAESQNKQENKVPERENKASKRYVLVELFTSEGCSSCPPADRVLARLESEQPVENVEIVPLAFHVDYWNYLGWRDEFSSNAFSQRQNDYAGRFGLNSIYTPQMVVDGQKQFTGSQFDTAINSVKETAQTKKAYVEMSLDDKNLSVKINDLPVHDDAYVWLAITENNLQTDVRRGENSGKKLSHEAVVREMKLIGNINAGEAEFVKSENLTVQPAWKRENLNLIVFVQGQNSKNVFAVGKTKLI